VAALIAATPCLAQDHPGGMLGFETPWWPEVRRECPPVFRSGTTDKWSHLETCLVDVLSDDPIHPVVASIAPMSGLGAGLSSGWDLSHGRDQTDLAARALASVDKSWELAAEYTIAPRLRGSPARTPDRPRFDAYATAQELSQLAFYDIGPSSSRASRRFGEHELEGGADYTTPLTEWLRIGGRLEVRRPSLEGHMDVDEATAPGITSQPTFVHYDAIVQLHHPSSPPTDADAMLDYHVFEDLDGGHYSFGRLTALLTWSRALARLVPSDASSPSLVDRVFCHEAKVRDCDYGTITLRGRLAVSNTFERSVVPFYYQPTLGGTDIDGYDTLRAFADYRFRSPDDWLGQVEYGHPIWGPLGLLVFYDVGQVALSATRVRQDFGVGASVTMLGDVVLRAYLAVGGGEGLGSGLKLAQPTY
jgi:hypothetical protein